MIAAPHFQKAQFKYTQDGAEHVVPVDFNPSTLDYTVTINAQGEGGQTNQVASTASAKLNMELLFDTTDSGEDVRTKTNKVELMLKSGPSTGATGAPPTAAPTVTFEWGAFSFSGIVDSFKQTMDFFAPNGLPLRASVTLSISAATYNFDQKGGDAGNNLNVDQPFVLPDGDPSALATAAGDPTAARGIASANGLESLRASAGASIAVGGGVSIGAAATFSAGASANVGLGASFGIGASAGTGGGAGFSASFGAGASAGVSASNRPTSGACGRSRFERAEMPPDAGGSNGRAAQQRARHCLGSQRPPAGRAAGDAALEPSARRPLAHDRGRLRERRQPHMVHARAAARRGLLAARSAGRRR